jgi:uncharacterized protein YjbJ (UPF0337 family)
LEVNPKADKEKTMNSDQLKGKWKQMKGSVKERWGKLTDDDLDVIDGQQDRLIGTIQEKYGIAREAAQKQVEEWNAVADRQAEADEKRLEKRRKAS